MTNFKKVATGALAALTLGGAIAATATPAAAQRYYGGRGYGRGGNVGGAVVAGLAGLAIGSAIAGGGRGYYGGGGYYGNPGYGYYGAPGYYGPRTYGYYGGPRCRVSYRYDAWGRAFPIERCW